MNLAKFVENLKGLMIVRNLSQKTLAESIGLSESTICRYLQGNREPSFANLVKLAEFFNCSADYLMGFDDYNSCESFLPCPPFSQRIQELVSATNLSGAAFCKQAHIPQGDYFAWKNGKRLPEPDGLIALAKFFDCSIDCILGREK